MPSASDELIAAARAALAAPAGHVDLEHAAVAHLERRGYVLKRDWCWLKPTPEHVVTREDALAVCYLIEDWDYGGVEGPWTPGSVENPLAAA